jgi:hypothetical protein
MLDWLPSGKRAAVVFTIDDIHPGKSTDAYEAGGDMDKGALGLVHWLLKRHPKLWVTLFTTPDWREIQAFPTRKLLAALPYIRDRVYLAPNLPVGTMRLNRHPEFVNYLKNLPNTEIALHGLYHIHRGIRIPVEFQEQDATECRQMLQESIAIFNEAGLPFSPGMNPPGWDLPPALAQAMAALNLTWVASSRDILTPISKTAQTNMSGRKGLSLIYPQMLPDAKLIHFSNNFQATSPIERAVEIIELGGIVAVKGHIVKKAFNHIALDGIDALYCNYLDLLFSELEDRYGDSLWWTSMGQIAERIVQSTPAAAQV